MNCWTRRRRFATALVVLGLPTSFGGLGVIAIRDIASGPATQLTVMRSAPYGCVLASGKPTVHVVERGPSQAGAIDGIRQSWSIL